MPDGITLYNTDNTKYKPNDYDAAYLRFNPAHSLDHMARARLLLGWLSRSTQTRSRRTSRILGQIRLQGMEGRDISITIQHLIFHLKELAEKLPHGYQSDALAWVRVRDAGEFAVLQISEVQQGYHQDHGGSVATLCLDQRA